MYSTYPTYLLHIQYLAQFAKPLADLEDSTNKTPSTGNVTAPISRLTAVDTRDPIIAMYIHRYLQSGETGYRVLKWQLPCGRWPTTLQGQLPACNGCPSPLHRRCNGSPQCAIIIMISMNVYINGCQPLCNHIARAAAGVQRHPLLFYLTSVDLPMHKVLKQRSFLISTVQRGQLPRTVADSDTVASLISGYTITPPTS